MPLPAQKVCIWAEQYTEPLSERSQDIQLARPSGFDPEHELGEDVEPFRLGLDQESKDASGVVVNDSQQI